MLKIKSKLFLWLSSFMICLFISCCPNIFSPKYEFFNPFSANEKLKISRACEIDSVAPFDRERYTRSIQNLIKVKNCKDITGIPADNDTISRLVELALVAEFRGKYCVNIFHPIMVKCNKPIHSAYLFGARIFQIYNLNYVKAFSEYGYRRCHIAIHISPYTPINGFFDNFIFRCKKSTEFPKSRPSYIVKYDSFYKFRCGEERRHYWFYVSIIRNEYKIVYYRTIEELNTCCGGNPVDSTKTK